MLAFRNSVNFSQHVAACRAAMPTGRAFASLSVGRASVVLRSTGLGRSRHAVHCAVLRADSSLITNSCAVRGEGISGFIRMWRRGYNEGKTNALEGILPNYWAKCLLIWH